MIQPILDLLHRLRVFLHSLITLEPTSPGLRVENFDGIDTLSIRSTSSIVRRESPLGLRPVSK